MHFLANHQEITRKEVQALLDVGRSTARRVVKEIDARMARGESGHGGPHLPPVEGPGGGRPAKMAACMIESVAIEPAPLRQVYGSQALAATIERLEKRVADYHTQTALTASADYPAGE